MTENIELQNVNATESRREQFQRTIFDRYDENNDGYLQLDELRRLLTADDERNRFLPNYVIRKILNTADDDNNGLIDFDEFCAMWENPNLAQYLKPYITSYIAFILPKSQLKRKYRMVDTAYNIETDGAGQYEDLYSCRPPSLAMFITTIIIGALFIADEIQESGSVLTGRGPIAQKLIFNPSTKEEAWRYMSYMFVHIGYMHLIINCLIQLLLGIPLEMVHGWWRVWITYLAGVLAGSLCTAITDPHTKLAGASGGVYALITAHIANILMNWSEMTIPLVQILIFLIITFCDIGTSIYNRYYLDVDNQVAYIAHFAGAVAGLLVGVQTLKNIRPTTKEAILWWLCLVIYIIVTIICIILNVTGTTIS